MPMYFKDDQSKQMVNDVRIGPIAIGDGEGGKVNAVGVGSDGHILAFTLKETDQIVAALQSVRAEVGKLNREAAETTHKNG